VNVAESGLKERILRGKKHPLRKKGQSGTSPSKTLRLRKRGRGGGTKRENKSYVSSTTRRETTIWDSTQRKRLPNSRTNSRSEKSRERGKKG